MNPTPAKTRTNAVNKTRIKTEITSTYVISSSFPILYMFFVFLGIFQHVYSSDIPGDTTLTLPPVGHDIANIHVSTF